MANLNDLLGKYVRDILDAQPVGVFISDTAGKSLYINQVYEQLTGLKLEEIEGKNVRSLVKEGIFDSVLNPEIVRTQKPVTHTQKLKNGKRLVLSGVPVFDKAGVLRLVVTFARDITLLSELRHQIEAQQKLIARINDQMSEFSQTSRSLYRSPEMLKTITLAEKLAPTDATVLILGETGVGKDVMGHFVHDLSSRRDKVMLKVDCAGISGSLIESELFGYAAGAFTGASSKGKAGYFELADNGTVFLDEIGELPLALQTKLLRVLQDGEIVRVGSSTPRKINTRIIAATNRNLAACVEEGTFRRDLFYRLNVASLHIPPLRERKEDIPGLAEHFLQQYCAKYRKSISFTSQAMDLMGQYAWPGNVRELQNAVHNLVITLNGRTISPADLPERISGLAQNRADEEIYSSGKTFREIMAEKERVFLSKAIEAHGSVQKVADLFQINRSTIFRKLSRPQDS